MELNPGDEQLVPCGATGDGLTHTVPIAEAMVGAAIATATVAAPHAAIRHKSHAAPTEFLRVIAFLLGPSAHRPARRVSWVRTPSPQQAARGSVATRVTPEYVIRDITRIRVDGSRPWVRHK